MVTPAHRRASARAGSRRHPAVRHRPPAGGPLGGAARRASLARLTPAARARRVWRAGEYTAFVQGKRLNTIEEQSEGRALEEVLDKCITLIIRRMDQDSDGVITKKDAAGIETKLATSAQADDGF